MEGTSSTPTTSTGTESVASSDPASTGTPTPATSTPTPAERPKTFAQAFAQDAATQTPPSTETGTATTQPAEGTDPLSATPLSTDAKGAPPQEKWPQILDNARSKAVADYQKSAGIDKAVEFATKINGNAPGFWKEYTGELLAHPQHGPALRSELARMFGGLRQAAQAKAAAAEPMPGPDVQIVDANGTVTGMTYSDKQLDLRDAWKEKRQMEARAKTEQAAAKAKVDAAEYQRQLDTKTDELLAEVTDTLELDDATPQADRNVLFAKVNELMRQNPGMTAHRAALEVRKTHIVPARAGKAQAQVLESLKTKAAAQAVNPAGAVVATTSRPRSFMDKSLQW